MKMRGLWLCAEPRTGALLGLHADPAARTWSIERRCDEAAEWPDESFVWWAVAAPGTYGRSHAGCVTASVPSTTGGGLVHACGDKAKSLCRASFTRTDRLSRALRPQCRAAGVGPASGSAPSGSGAG
jgi:hypothetical protein